MPLVSIVKLFRKSGQPEISGKKFTGVVSFDQDNIDLIESIRNLQSNSFEEIYVDGTEVFDSNQIPGSGNSIEFTLKLPSSDSKQFYESLEHLVEYSHQISRGELPDDFYLIDQDYLHSEDDLLPKIEKLGRICKLIKGLSALAHYHEARCTDHLKLIFLQPGDEEKPSPGVFEIETKITPELLEVEALDISLVQSLSTSEPSVNPHYDSERGIFWVSLSEFIKEKNGSNDSFTYLVINWKEFLTLYQKNLGTFLSGFAFHKAKKEIAEKEYAIAEQLSKVINDIIGKMLGIPISFAAILAITKSKNITECIIIVLGLLVAAIVLSGTVSNQQRQFERIKDSTELIIGSIEGKKDTYPEDLKNKIQKMTAALKNSQKKLSIILWTFRFFSWIPVFLAELVLIIFYTNWLKF